MIVYGHRGACGESPENTIAGCRHALARGAKRLEVDVRLSKDNKLVVTHDPRLKRTTGQKGLVSRHTAAELRKLDARNDGPPWPNKRHTGIPTLDALVKALPEILHWQLELKPGSDRYNNALVDAIAAWLDKQDAPERFSVTCSAPTLLTELRRQRPGQSVGFVSTITEPDYVLAACGCDYLVAHWSTLNPWLVKRVQAQSVHISAWTVNDASVIKNLYAMGVDSVITDYPSMAVPLVAQLSR